MSGLNARHLLELAVRPALQTLGAQYATLAAEQLVMGTAAKESGGLVWLRQLGNGPALGLWQMEPFTFRDLRDGFLSGDAPGKVQLRRAVGSFSASFSPDPTELCWNLRLAAAYCRLKYLSVNEPLPPAGDVAAMARYWKRYYNTRIGKGREEEFVSYWESTIQPVAGVLWPR